MSYANSSARPRIAIIGGGLGGLALLLTLHRRGIPLDLGWKSGQRALRKNGLQDEFDTHSRSEGEDMAIFDSAGEVHFKLGGDGEDSGPPQANEAIRPEIDRAVLRKILLDAVPAHLVQWGHALSSVRALRTAGHRQPQHELAFANGATTTCALPVRADGAHSRVCPLLCPAALHFLGVAGVEISLAPATARLPALAETRADDARYPRALWSLPVGHKATHVPGVTLIGDAAHLTSPFAGAGANLALLDGLELGLALAGLQEKGQLGEVGAVSAAVAAFEEDMCAMAGRVAAKANATLEVFVGPGTPQAAIKWFGELAAGGEREGRTLSDF